MSKGGLAGSAFLADDRDSFHGLPAWCDIVNTCMHEYVNT